MIKSNLQTLNNNEKQVNSFKDLMVWQKSLQLFLDINKDVKNFPKSATANTIERQIIRSASSISANIAEGFGRYKGKEFCRFLLISRGATTETQDWLIKAYNLGFIDELIYQKRIRPSDEIIKMINAMLSRLRRNDK